MSDLKNIMWILRPVLSIIVIYMLEVTADNNTTSGSYEKGTSAQLLNKACADPLVYGTICFLAALNLILLMFLFKVFNARHATSSQNRESTPVNQNHESNVHPPSVNGADGSSLTSSESPDGSPADVSRRYASLQGPHKQSDYINTAEEQVEFMNIKTRKDKDYVNVNELHKNFVKKDQKNCDDCTSISSDTSAESAVNYSKVVFTK